MQIQFTYAENGWISANTSTHICSNLHFSNVIAKIIYLISKQFLIFTTFSVTSLLLIALILFYQFFLTLLFGYYNMSLLALPQKRKTQEKGRGQMRPN
jgi:hypothetical protein